jgi:hypothetical protein
LTEIDLPPPRKRTQSQVDRDEALSFARHGPFPVTERPSGKHFISVKDLVVPRKKKGRREKDGGS